MSITRIVLTGGPCAGKSTGLAIVEQRLTNLGYKVIVMDEMPTNVLRSGLTPPNPYALRYRLSNTSCINAEI